MTGGGQTIVPGGTMPGELRGNLQVVGLVAEHVQPSAATVNGIAFVAIVRFYVER